MNTNNDKQTQFPNTVGIIGFGKLGSVLAYHFSGLSELSWIVIKNNAPKHVLGLSTSILDSIQQIQVIPQLIILAVPDDEIGPCSAQLSMHLKQNTDTLIIHCSGALGKDILQSCKNKGARIAAIHPFQTFFGQVNLQGIPWTIDADEENQSLCNRFALKSKRGFKKIPTGIMPHRWISRWPHYSADWLKWLHACTCKSWRFFNFMLVKRN